MDFLAQIKCAEMQACLLEPSTLGETENQLVPASVPLERPLRACPTAGEAPVLRLKPTRLGTRAARPRRLLEDTHSLPLGMERLVAIIQKQNEDTT